MSIMNSDEWYWGSLYGLNPVSRAVLCCSGPVFPHKLRWIVGFWLVVMAISTNQKPTIYRNFYSPTPETLLTDIISTKHCLEYYCLGLTTLKYVCINHGDERVFINFKSS